MHVHGCALSDEPASIMSKADSSPASRSDANSAKGDAAPRSIEPESNALPRAKWWVLVLLFAGALAFRIGYLNEASQLPDFEAPLVDAGYHDYWAWGIASGEWAPAPNVADPEIRSTPYFRPPLVVFWMASIFGVIGHQHYTARVLQCLLGAGACVLTYLLGRRLFGEGSGLCAGVLAALYWILIYFDTEYREVTFLAFLYVAVMLALLRYRDRPSLKGAVWVGLLHGAAILAKPNGLLLIPLLLVWMVLVTRMRSSRRQHWIHASGLVAAVLLCVLPVSIRNLTAGDDAVLISSNGGINFYIGNNAFTDGTQVCLPPDLPRFDSAYDYPDIVRAVEARNGHSMTHSEVSSWFVSQALEHISQNLGATLGLWARKAVGFWAGTEIVSEKDLVGSRRESTVLRLLPLNFASIFAVGVLGLGLALARKRPNSPAASKQASYRIDREGVWLVAGFMLLFGLSFTPFFVTARYRAPIIPLLLTFTGFGLWRVALWVRTRELARTLASLAIGAAIFFVDGALIEDWGLLQYRYDPAKAIAERGALLAVRGDSDEAEAAFRKAVGLNPDNPQALNNLGQFLRTAGKPAEALGHLQRSIAIDPSDYRAHQNLGFVLLDLNKPREAVAKFKDAHSRQRRNAMLTLEAGDALRAAGHLGPARDFLRLSLGVDPSLTQANFSMGLVYLAAGEPAGAVPFFQKLTQGDPSNAAGFSMLGVALDQSGQKDAAIQAFLSAVELEPNNPRFRENLERARTGAASGG
ncbi:MAG: Flp pilus assembly protein TadD/4-amino-4-deoxy-L-arabinose transferase-like glycosyltransferase [Planctomycetota bacterium]